MSRNVVEGAGVFETRTMRPQDAAAVAAILNRAPEAAQWPEPALWHMAEQHGAAAFVAKHDNDDDIAGFVFGRAIAGEAEILNLAVYPQYRRQGVAKALTEALLSEWSQRGVNRVFLEVRESNSGALTFYYSIGFRLSGRRKGYYEHPSEDALVLDRYIPHFPQVSVR